MAEIVTKARDTMDKLRNPRSRYQVVNKLDTEEINRLKARYAYIKRKEFLFELISRFDNKKTSDREERRSNWSASPCSELNFQANDDEGRREKEEGMEEEEDDQQQESVDMGDYENRIKPSPNYWYILDGRNLAEKIIYYRTYRLQSTTELESTLINYKRPTTPANLAVPTLVTQAILEPALIKPVVLPVTNNNNVQQSVIQPGSKSAKPNRQLAVQVGPRPKTGPSAVNGKGPNKITFNNKAFDESELRAESVNKVENEKIKVTEEQTVKEAFVRNKKKKKKKQKSENQQIQQSQQNENVIDETKEEEETLLNETAAVKQTKEEIVEKTNIQEEKEICEEKEIHDKKEIHREKEIHEEKEAISRSSDSSFSDTKRRAKLTREGLEKDAVIAKLDKRIEKDLKALQGIQDDGDDNDGGLDDDAFNDILQGNINKELDEFLKIH
ncbi:hypothetical protein HELRODRAFT_188888 [Helobdella robusta]|uniref:Uncharacterized protein n=1 Tax=Helobdella robusta TaxID=6412 RepID=T1FQF9_HELRO|nr:hypothetical protein HELRODRAFT_188888 [Helobdella robusta]ESN98720.1 hypothetical protein HELRODRAFT_188888 [Helobdella robusta]